MNLDDGVRQKTGSTHGMVDRIERAATTAEDRTGSIQNTLDNMGGR